MTNSQIKQELRRSACGVEYPMSLYLSKDAFEEAYTYIKGGLDYKWDEHGDQKRIFFLLVAEAI